MGHLLFIGGIGMQEPSSPLRQIVHIAACVNPYVHAL